VETFAFSYPSVEPACDTSLSNARSTLVAKQCVLPAMQCSVAGDLHHALVHTSQCCCWAGVQTVIEYYLFDLPKSNQRDSFCGK